MFILYLPPSGETCNGYICCCCLNVREVNAKHKHRVCLASLNLRADRKNCGYLFIWRCMRLRRAYKVNQHFGGCIYNSGFWAARELLSAHYIKIAWQLWRLGNRAHANFEHFSQSMFYDNYITGMKNIPVEALRSRLLYTSKHSIHYCSVISCLLPACY